MLIGKIITEIIINIQYLNLFKKSILMKIFKFYLLYSAFTNCVFSFADNCHVYAIFMILKKGNNCNLKYFICLFLNFFINKKICATTSFQHLLYFCRRHFLRNFSKFLAMFSSLSFLLFYFMHTEFLLKHAYTHK